jgi:hypothetical protein
MNVGYIYVWAHNLMAYIFIDLITFISKAFMFCPEVEVKFLSSAIEKIPISFQKDFSMLQAGN